MTQSPAHTDSRTSLQALRRTIYELQAATDIHTLNQVVRRYVQEQLGYEFVWLGVYDSDHEILEGPWLRSSDEPAQSAVVKVLPGDLFDQVLLTRQFAVVPNLQEENRAGTWQDLAKDLSIQGSVLHSLRYQRESLGILLVSTSKWGINPRQDESEQLTILANTIGATLHNLRENNGDNSLIQSAHASIDEAFSALLGSLATAQSWDDQLTCMAESISHLAPVSGLYLFDTDKGEFICQYLNHPQHKRSSRTRRSFHALSFHQNRSFVQSLERQSHLGIADVSSNIGTSIPNALITFLNARALLFKPILMQQAVKGFWVLGSPDPTQWSDQDKNILTRFASLVELTYPSTSQPTAPSFGGDSSSRLGSLMLPSSLADPEDWDKGLDHWFRGLTQQFQCQWSILLTFDKAQNGYVPTKYYSSNRRVGLDRSILFKKLSPVDEKLLTRHDSALGLSDLQDDMRLLAWRDLLVGQGIQSLLVSCISSGPQIHQCLLLGHTAIRHWSEEEPEDLHQLAQKLYQAQNRRAQHVAMLDERRLNQFFRQGIEILHKTNSSSTFVQQSAQLLVDLFGISGCSILLWPPQRQFAKVKASISPGEDYFTTSLGTKVDLKDPLIQELLKPAYDPAAHLAPVCLSSAHLAEETQRWLFTRGEWSLMGLPLQPQPKKPVFGVLLLASPDRIEMTDAQRNTLSDFVRHMAWVLYNSHVSDAWRKDYAALHTAHWYHNKLLGHSFETMLQQFRSSQAASSANEKHMRSTAQAVVDMEHTVTHLYDYNAKLVPELKFEMESITLVRLLREVLDRLEATFSAKQIWVQVHHLKQSNVALKSSKVHLTYILDEVLKAAVARSEVGGRIDVWCRMNHPEWLDLSITDEGQFDRQFLRDLNLGHQRDRLRPSLVNEDIGQRLLACHTLIQSLGGKLEFRSLEDQRSLTRFMLPCVTD